MTKNNCCLENLEFDETPVANELEIWHCSNCETYYDLPIEITRHWNKLKMRGEDKHTDAIQRSIKRLRDEIGFGVKDGRWNESQIK